MKLRSQGERLAIACVTLIVGGLELASFSRSPKAPPPLPPVPIAALRFHPRDLQPPATSGDTRTAWVLRRGTPRPIAVRIGSNDGTLTEILEGELREGHEAVVEAVCGDEAPLPKPPGAPPGPPPGPPGGGMFGGPL